MPGPKLSYVLPLCSSSPRLDLTGYLQSVSCFPAVGEVLVVDGSPPPVREVHARAWAELPAVRHLALDEHAVTPMGKVGGVLAGVAAAVHDVVVLADDDVRWRAGQLAEAADRLRSASVLRPQNYFDPRPWHACWDTGRILLNRVAGGDWPGTLVVRRSALVDAGGYAGDVMFENLELVRTLQAAGGREVLALDLLVQRLAPSTGQFLAQRIRQAYDELARPWRLVVFCSLAPLVAASRGRALAPLAVLAVGAAEVGRRRGGGRQVFPPAAALWAPLWLAERSVTSWLALGSHLFMGGVRYRGGTLRRAATPMRQLRARRQ